MSMLEDALVFMGFHAKILRSKNLDDCAEKWASGYGVFHEPQKAFSELQSELVMLKSRCGGDWSSFHPFKLLRTLESKQNLQCECGETEDALLGCSDSVPYQRDLYLLVHLRQVLHCLAECCTVMVQDPQLRPGFPFRAFPGVPGARRLM